ncbi:protein NnrT [Cereibacter sphaeroides]|uniref:protein NnrT n=1 Tax=Rhodobacterales TaxID=204455 RepID=UPI000BBE807E|nr:MULTISPECIES: protein NnrT [Paracoccaceae]MCE6950944.1 protein NnrT [Cereibacter sphaeroides]MCE6960474.1 protein NnrT [Cereibacter sphaeroides]MCE6969424.1 protein NnrT [Cereibacter sphaeroides]MCE6975482.1 protein NnrT [Cereibacter sphaeroides]
MRILLPLLILIPGAVAAATFERPVPQAQTDVAEFWFAMASLGFVLALAAVQWMVQRR